MFDFYTAELNHG